MIDGIVERATRRLVGRSPARSRTGSAAGLEVTLHFDERPFPGSGLFLFACVLERFLDCTARSIRSPRMVATTNKREGELRRWAPRAGETVLL